MDIVPTTNQGRFSAIRFGLGSLLGLLLAWAAKSEYILFLPRLSQLPLPVYYLLYASFFGCVFLIRLNRIPKVMR
jgi:hypothetical protein